MDYATVDLLRDSLSYLSRAQSVSLMVICCIVVLLLCIMLRIHLDFYFLDAKTKYVCAQVQLFKRVYVVCVCVGVCVCTCGSTVH